MQFSYFHCKADQEFFIKIGTKIMLSTQTKQTILIHNFNFDEKTLFHFKKFNKTNQIVSHFQKSRSN